MDITPLIPQGRQIIQGYGPEGLRVNGTTYQGAIIVTPQKTWNWNVPATFSDLAEEDFSEIYEGMADPVDVLLAGCGAKGMFVSPALREGLKRRGLSVDAMDTGAACRTYNVLMAEGRRVAAALFPVA